MAETKIEWADYTFNPWRGCTKIAEGCKFCYADAMSGRNPGTLGVWGPNGKRVVAAESYWKLPEKWNRQAGERFDRIGDSAFATSAMLAEASRRPRVFLGSLMDIFEDWQGPMVDSVGETYHISADGPIQMASGARVLTMQDVRSRVFGIIGRTPHLDWLLLTKRPENIEQMMPREMTARENCDGNDCRSQNEEIWASVPGHPGYMVSNFGRAKGPRGTILAGLVGEQGHTRIQLGNSKTRKLLHRLVMEAFVGQAPSPTHQVRHLDGNPRNNRLENLQWGTQSENWADSKKHGTYRRYSKLNQSDVDVIRERAKTHSFSSLADDYGVSATQISNIFHGRQWVCGTKPNNWWLGYSASTQEDLDRGLPHLLKVPAAVRFLSLEPLLGPVDFANVTNRSDAVERWGKKALGGIGWVVVGGESGPNARPMHPDWVRSIRDQCRSAGVPFFMKQMGGKRKPFEPIPDDLMIREFPNA